jgi:hypothetical protein
LRRIVYGPQDTKNFKEETKSSVGGMAP